MTTDTKPKRNMTDELATDLTSYIRDKHTQDECVGFSDGYINGYNKGVTKGMDLYKTSIENLLREAYVDGFMNNSIHIRFNINDYNL